MPPYPTPAVSQRKVVHMFRMAAKSRRTVLLLQLLVLLGTSYAHVSAQPWVTAAVNAQNSILAITNPLCIIAIIFAGLAMWSGRGGHAEQIGKVAFGIGLVLGAPQVLAWIHP